VAACKAHTSKRISRNSSSANLELELCIPQAPKRGYATPRRPRTLSSSAAEPSAGRCPTMNGRAPPASESFGPLSPRRKPPCGYRARTLPSYPGSRNAPKTVDLGQRMPDSTACLVASPNMSSLSARHSRTSPPTRRIGGLSAPGVPPPLAPETTEQAPRSSRDCLSTTCPLSERPLNCERAHTKYSHPDRCLR